MRKRQLARLQKQEMLGVGMTGDDVRLAIAALDWEHQPHMVARVFDVTPRTVWRWQVVGAPPHIAVAFDELLTGRIKPRGIKWLLRRIGKSRNDGDRYGAPKSTSSASGAGVGAG